MPRVRSGWSNRFSKELFVSPGARRLRRQKRRAKADAVDSRAIAAVDVALEQRLMLSAVTVASDDIQAADISIASVDAVDSSADFLTVQAGVTVQSTTGTVTLNAGDNLNLGAGALVSAVSTVSLGLDVGDADSGAGSTATLENTFAGTLVSVIGGPDNDDVLLSPSAFADVPMNIDLNGGTANSVEVDLTGVTDPVLTYTSSTSGTITSSSHQTVTFTDVQSVDVKTGTGTFGNVVVDLSSLAAGNDAAADTTTVAVNGTDIEVSVNGTLQASFAAAAASAITINGSGDDDSFQIDHSAGLLTVPVTINGQSGSDLAAVKGDGVESATYTPDATTTGNGTVAVTNAGLLTFTGLTPLDVSNMATATLNLPSADDVLTIAEGFDFATGSTAALVVSGTSNAVAIESVAFFNNGTVVVDTSTSDGTDTVTVNGASNAHANDSLSIQTGGTATDGDVLNLNGNVTVADHVSMAGAAVNLQSNSSVTAGGSLTIVAPIDGAFSLNLSGDSVHLDQEVGGTTPLTSLTIASALGTLIEADITTSAGITISDDLDVDGGITITGTPVTFQGDISPGLPGDDTDILTVSGNLVMSNRTGDDLTMHVHGKTTAGDDYDQLVVSGGVTLDGVLDLVGTFTDTGVAGDEIVLIDNDGSDAVVGTFSNYTNGDVVVLNGQDWRLLYDGGDGNDVSLRFGLATAISVSDATVTEGDSGAAVLEFTVTSTTAIGEAFRVTYASADDSADSATDYTIANSSINFLGTTSGETQTISISVNGDELVERDEQLLLFLTNVLDTTNASFSDSTAVGTITNDDSAILSIDTVTSPEGDSGTSQLNFTVTLDANVDTAVTVDYATADDSATVADSDYDSTSGNLSFTGSVLESHTISVTVNGDTTPEFDEVLNVMLSNLNASGRNVVLSSATTTGTIIDDDRVPVELSLSSASGSESAGTVITVTATADEAVSGDQSIGISLVGTGISAGDYSLSNSTISILDGQTTGSVTLTIVDDEIVELTEVATVSFNNPSGGIRVGTVGADTVSISSDDIATLSIGAAETVETDSGSTTMTFDVTLDKAVDAGLSVNFATGDGTATVADSDYQSNSGTLNFTGGQGEVQSISVTVNGDDVVELAEVFQVLLSDLNGNGRPVSLASASANGSITNDDSATLSIADVTEVEEDTGQSTFSFAITLTGDVDTGVSVVASTSDDTATTADSDYVALAGQTLQFDGTDAEQKTVSVTINGDRFVEPDEAFQVLLTALNASGRNVTLADDTAVGTITNDDSPVPVNLSSSVLTGSEADETVITLTVTADEPVGGDQTIEVSLAGIDSTDAELSTTTVTIPNGGTTGSVTLTILDDSVVEDIETAVVSIDSVSAGLVVGTTTSASISVVDDDTATVSINDVSMLEGESGTTDFVFTVSLSAVVDADVSLNYSTATSTASVSDFSAASGSVSFVAGSTDSQTITVSVNGDSIVELDEEFLVNLSGLNASGLNVTFADSQGRATIENDDQATVSIGDVAIAEGDSGTSNYSFTVTLSHVVDNSVSVNYSTTDGSATAPADYTAITSNTVSFSGATAGETKTIQVLVVGETSQEIDETFLVDLISVGAGGRDVVIGDARGTATIIDDDGIAVNLSADASSGSEAGTSTITLTATAASAVTGAQTMNVSVTGDRVTANDYVLSDSMITILDGETTGTVTLTVADDDLTEILETATVTISSFPVELSAGSTTSVDISLVDNDQTTLTIADITVSEGNTGPTTATFTVVADNAVDTAFTVDYATADGTATVADGDYVAQSPTALNFSGAAGQQVQFSIDVTGDNTVELDETFLVNLANLQAAGRNVTLGQTSATATITNDDSASLTISDFRMTEGDSGTTTFQIDVTLSDEVDAPVTVEYSTVDGTAEAGTDYTAVSNATLTFTGASGQIQTASVLVTGDTVAERDEVFQIVLQNLTIDGGRPVSIADGTSDVTIADDDGIIVNFGVSSTSASEADGTVITLVASAAEPLAAAETVDLIVTGTDIDGNDYSLSDTSITIAAGQTIGTATFTVLDDTLVESLETALISFTNPSAGIALGPVTSQSIAITSDDDATLTIMDQTVVEGDSGTLSVTFNVILSDAVDNSFTVDFATSDGTATTADGDYASNSGTLTFSGAALESQSITVVVNGDTANETDETFFVTLSNLVSGSTLINLPANPAMGTIVNDDGAVEVNISVSPTATAEVNADSITITAVAASPVAGDQTVVVDISGMGITATDYSLPEATINILDGETTGSVILQILNDGNIEAATETMVVALTSPSSGLSLGTAVSANVTIQDSSAVIPNAIDRFQTGQPTLTWAAVPGATGYEVWFSRIFPETAVLEVDRDVTGTSWQVPGNLDSAMYRYWIRAENADGDFTAWSEATQFEVRPQLISPIGGSFSRTPTFEWEAIPLATSYELYLSSSNGVERIENITGTSYTPSTALPDGEVRWWIRAEEAIGNRGWSAVGYASSVVKPVLLAPIGNTTTTTPTFSWNNIPGAGRYVLYVQNLDVAEVVINDVTLTTNSYTPTTALAAGNYRFWVKAIDAATNDFNSGLWSNPVDFEITLADAEDQLGSPLAAVLVRMDSPVQAVDVERVNSSNRSESIVEVAATQATPAHNERPDVRIPKVSTALATGHATATGLATVADAGAAEAANAVEESDRLIDSLMSTASDWLL